MIIGVSVISCSLVYLIILAIIFFKKDKVKNFETNTYGSLLVLNIIGLILELCCCFTVSNMDKLGIINEITNRIYLMYYITFITTFTIYIYYITFNKEYSLKKFLTRENKKSRAIVGILYIVGYLTVLLLPLYYHNNNEQVYSYGPAVNVLSLFCVIYMIFVIYAIVKNIKNVKASKLAPLITLIICFVFAFIIRNINPAIILITSSFALVTMIMFFTIENPDMKLLEEVHKSKEISDNANEEKTLFVYNMTQEIRSATNEIDHYANEILDSDSIEESKDSARNIKGTISKFTSMTNEILDVSKIDSANIKIYNTKYNIKNILKQVINVYNDICKNKELTFRTNIDHDIPEILYGDSINLKEVLTIILNNSTKYTEKGYIELNINTIIKNDICRLMITVEDSGNGIKSEDINKIKIDNKSLAKANKLITLMNGTMLISSNYGMGTKVKIILDQKIELNNDNEVTKYDVEFKNTNILMVDDSESGIKIIEKLLKGTNINLDTSNNGKDCLEKVKANKYDLILLDEELTQITGSELLKKIKEIRNFKTPVILLTKDNSYEYNEEYLKLGFEDYILKPAKKDILLSKINENINKK